ncbi:MAG: diguanylate cyclase [Casimicrobiaceae bacterium]
MNNDVLRPAPGANRRSHRLQPARQRRFSLTRHRLSLWALPAFGLLLIAGLWLTIHVQLQTIQRVRLAAITQETESLAASYEQFTRRALDDADRMARVIKYEYERNETLDLQGLIRAGVIDDTTIGLISVFDANGALIAASEPMPAINISDRDYFKLHKSRDLGFLDVSPPIVGRDTGRTVILLSRRINTRDGRFAGIVVLSVAPEYFTRMYSSVDLGNNGSLLLVGLDGALRARRAGGVTTSTEDGSGKLLVARTHAASQGTYEKTSSYDGVTRYAAYRQLPDYPFVVAIGKSRDEALAAYAAIRDGYYFVAAVVTLVIVAFFALVTILALRLQRHRIELKRERQFLESVLDNIPSAITVRSMRGDGRGRYVLWNEACETMFGVSARVALGKTLPELLPPALSVRMLALDAALLANPSVQHADEVIDVPQRGSRIFHLVRAPVMDGNNQVDYIMVVATDVTDERAHTNELRLASKVFETTADGIVLSDGDDRVIMVNAGFSALTGFDAAEVLGLRVEESPFRAIDLPEYALRMERLRRDGYDSGEVQRVARDGSMMSLWITATCLRDAGGTIVNYVRVFSDISLLKATQHKLVELASYDTLTGLPNRRLLQERLDRALVRAQRNKGAMALMFIDLDGFKDVNDTLGHDTGDMLLRQVASRLEKCIRTSDSIARFGGDEFAIVLEDANLPDDAVLVGERIVASLVEPFHLNGHRVTTAASIGIAIYPQDGSDAATLLKNADIAMYEAKRNGRNRFVLHATGSAAVDPHDAVA